MGLFVKLWHNIRRHSVNSIKKKKKERTIIRRDDLIADDTFYYYFLREEREEREERDAPRMMAIGFSRDGKMLLHLQALKQEQV
jgi:hypothetical protein